MILLMEVLSPFSLQTLAGYPTWRNFCSPPETRTNRPGTWWAGFYPPRSWQSTVPRRQRWDFGVQGRMSPRLAGTVPMFWCLPAHHWAAGWNFRFMGVTHRDSNHCMSGEPRNLHHGVFHCSSAWVSLPINLGNYGVLQLCKCTFCRYFW